MIRPVLISLVGVAAAAAFVALHFFGGTSESVHENAPVAASPSEFTPTRPVNPPPKPPLLISETENPSEPLTESISLDPSPPPPPEADFPTISQAELSERAQKIEQRANHELDILQSHFTLSELEQDRIFAALASRSRLFHPSLQFDNGSGVTIEGPGSFGAPQREITAPEVNDPGQATRPPESPDDSGDPVAREVPPELLERYKDLRAERDEFWQSLAQRLEEQLTEKSAPPAKKP